MAGARKTCRRLLNPTVVGAVIILTAIILAGPPQLRAASGGRADAAAESGEESQNGLGHPFREKADQWRTVRMRVTAYCPCEKCCGEYADGVTACGHKIKPGDSFAAADKKYAFGTAIIVPGYNNSQAIKVLDRGGAIRGERLDVFFHSHQEALNWGVQYLDVKVLVESAAL